MKYLPLIFGTLFVSGILVVGCKPTSKPTQISNQDSTFMVETVTDSTVYGTCGEGTTMHSLELIKDTGDTIQYMINETKDDGTQNVFGGMLVGDRMAILEGEGKDGDRTANIVINLTSLMGKWKSLDKNFELVEGGLVKSNLKAESHPWTTWKIYNGYLILNNDTFAIDKLGKDSLYLENKNGIFTFKRS